MQNKSLSKNFQEILEDMKNTQTNKIDNTVSHMSLPNTGIKRCIIIFIIISLFFVIIFYIEHRKFKNL